MREGDKREEVEANGLRGPTKKKRSVMFTIALVLVSVSICLSSMFTFVCAGTSLFLIVLALVSMFTFAC
jgi:hypothetical protein